MKRWLCRSLTWQNCSIAETIPIFLRKSFAPIYIVMLTDKQVLHDETAKDLAPLNNDAVWIVPFACSGFSYQQSELATTLTEILSEADKIRLADGEIPSQDA